MQIFKLPDEQVAQGSKQITQVPAAVNDAGGAQEVQVVADPEQVKHGAVH